MSDSGTTTDDNERPIRPNLFRAAGAGRGPLLLGSRCRETGTLFFPAEVMNPDTHRAGTMEPVEIEGAGRIYSVTKIARGLSGFASPYALAVIQLDAGPSLIAQLEDWQDQDLRIGVPVDLVIGTIKTEKDGTRITGPKFRPRRARG
jgi:uncharacterized OB-fold protein